MKVCSPGQAEFSERSNRAVLFAVVLLSSLLVLSGCAKGSGGRFTVPAPGEEPPGEQPAFPLVDHVNQADITSGALGFVEVFTFGDELFETEFNTFDGVGALVLPDGTPLPSRFSRVPPGGGRVTGPNAQACNACHNTPFPTSAGEAASNVFQDPAATGAPPFNGRNAISLFGSAVPQRLAEEISEDLQALRDEAAAAAQPGGPPVERDLVSKGISYGKVTASRDTSGVVSFDLSGVLGVDLDLIVRPYGWKGDVPTLRGFCRDAARNELGMEADELVAKDPAAGNDPDGDGVEGELSVGDVTALTIYVAAQEIPQPLGRLVSDRLTPPPTSEVGALIEQGRLLFGQIGCASCHIPELHLRDPLFEEPTLRGGGGYFDPEIDPGATALDPARPFRFHLVREGDFPRLEPHPAGGARVALFGDLKRHNMGRGLADAQPTSVTGANGRPLQLGGMAVTVPVAFFLTPELWGVGNTGPWLHDGRASSLEEAILLHGEDVPPPTCDLDRSEAQEARDAFVSLASAERLAVVEFLRSLLLFSLPEEEEEE